MREKVPVARGLFVATILVGSFLLFLVQPMVARMALPQLGGATVVLMIGGIAGSHPLLFVPIWYLVLGMVLGDCCFAAPQSWPGLPERSASHPTPSEPGLLGHA